MHSPLKKKLKSSTTFQVDVRGSFKFMLYFMAKLARRFGGSAYTLVRCLRKRGWKGLGSGFFSYVLATPCGRYALKIARNYYKKGNALWMRYARQNPGHMHLPKVFFHTRTRFGAITLMERLAPVPHAWRHKAERFCDMVHGREEPQPHIDGPQMVELVHTLRRADPDRLDLKCENVMMRGLRLVVTDPFVA